MLRLSDSQNRLIRQSRIAQSRETIFHISHPWPLRLAITPSKSQPNQKRTAFDST